MGWNVYHCPWSICQKPNRDEAWKRAWNLNQEIRGDNPPGHAFLTSRWKAGAERGSPYSRRTGRECSILG